MVAPLSTMPADLTRRINKIEKAVQDSARDSIRRAAIAAKAAQLDQMRHDVGGDLILSRVRSGKGARIGARYTLTGTGTTTTATVKATGPVPLIANRIEPHRIPRAVARRRRKRLAIPGIGVRSAVNHPGTRGKDTWNKGRREATPAVTKIIGRNTDRAVVEAFRTG
jgi:hypothetical protein